MPTAGKFDRAIMDTPYRLRNKGLTYMKSPLYAALLVCTGLLSLPAYAADPISARQAEFKKILRAFEPMGTMVRDRDPYKADAFLQHAQALKTLSHTPWPHFVAGTHTGKTRAKAEIWSRAAEFKTEQNTFIQRVDDLVAAAKSSDIQKIRPVYNALAQSCKSCHDSFRNKNRPD